MLFVDSLVSIGFSAPRMTIVRGCIEVFVRYRLHFRNPHSWTVLGAESGKAGSLQCSTNEREQHNRKGGPAHHAIIL
jgi:hypothetical protein